MKNVHVLLISILFVNFLNSQSMHTEEELIEFKERVGQTRKLGRAAIINTASKRAMDDPESLVYDQNILVSVWYNNAEVKVEFKERSPIKYLSYGAEVYFKMAIKVSVNEVSGYGGTIIHNTENNKSRSPISSIYLYRTTKETQTAIDHVLKLNNTNAPKYHIDRSSQINTIIKEQKKYYEMQIGGRYAITYKIDKKTGCIYDYKDPYKNFYPNPSSSPNFPTLFGSWIEIEE